jgi:hypothetical protein
MTPERPMSAKEEELTRAFLKDADEKHVFSITMARKMVATIDQLRDTIEKLRAV